MYIWIPYRDQDSGIKINLSLWIVISLYASSSRNSNSNSNYKKAQINHFIPKCTTDLIQQWTNISHHFIYINDKKIKIRGMKNSRAQNIQR